MDGWQTSYDSQMIPSVFALIVSSLVPSLRLPTVSTWSWNGLSRDSPFFSRSKKISAIQLNQKTCLVNQTFNRKQPNYEEQSLVYVAYPPGN